MLLPVRIFPDSVGYTSRHKLAFAVGIAGVIASSSMMALWIFTDGMGAIISIALLLSHSSILIALKYRKPLFFHVYLMIQLLFIIVCFIVGAIFAYMLVKGKPPGIVADRYRLLGDELSFVNSTVIVANETSADAEALVKDGRGRLDPSVVALDLTVFGVVLVAAVECYRIVTRAKKHMKQQLAAEREKDKKKQLAWRILRTAIGLG